uniref:Uncharacterized protein n=1 Tax=Anguilla anguilla TaxID=7936 RepID=A0A0E9XBX0_ANGAN
MAFKLTARLSDPHEEPVLTLTGLLFYFLFFVSFFVFLPFFFYF